MGKVDEKSLTKAVAPEFALEKRAILRTHTPMKSEHGDAKSSPGKTIGFFEQQQKLDEDVEVSDMQIEY